MAHCQFLKIGQMSGLLLFLRPDFACQIRHSALLPLRNIRSIIKKVPISVAEEKAFSLHFRMLKNVHCAATFGSCRGLIHANLTAVIARLSAISELLMAFLFLERPGQKLRVYPANMHIHKAVNGWSHEFRPQTGGSTCSNP